MNHVSVSSSTIESVAHDPESSTMEVKFKNGTTYHYHGVPADLHEDMLQSSSVGKFLNEHIKNKHSYSQQ